MLSINVDNMFMLFMYNFYKPFLPYFTVRFITNKFVYEIITRFDKEISGEFIFLFVDSQNKQVLPDRNLAIPSIICELFCEKTLSVSFLYLLSSQICLSFLLIYLLLQPCKIPIKQDFKKLIVI